MSNKNIITLLLSLFLAPALSAQEWIVPDEFREIANPLEYNIQNVEKGKELYLKNCKSCHGEPGKNNALPLNPPPPDIASDVLQANSEGEMFYKITNGKDGMPQFKSSLSEDERWKVINYIMNFNPKRSPLLVEAPPVKAKIMASVNESEKIVEVFAEYENEKGQYTALSNAVVAISAKKAFGSLPIGTATTSESGRAEFLIPKTVIGDEEGYLNIVVSMDENFLAEEVVLEKAKVGQMKNVPQLIRKEILWSTNENVQTWLLLSYLGATGAAWLAIGYIVFLIIRIRKLSQ